ncbi:MAG TPA: acylphosphatase [Bacteroidota bacterium]|nr:acylphosphatase [Bacteroidota bacterium]
METGAKILVSGLVQGVGFRYFAHRHATRLGLHGYARNLPNGEVEIHVEGERGMIEEFLKEVKVGPRSAMVRDLKIEWVEPSRKFRGFDIR